MFLKFIFLDTTLAFLCFTIYYMNNKEVDEETRKSYFCLGFMGVPGKGKVGFGGVHCSSFLGQILLELNLKLENKLAVWERTHLPVAV